MNHIFLALGVLGSLQTPLTLAMTLFGDESPVEVNFCCPDGQMLKLINVRDIPIKLFLPPPPPTYRKAECVRRRGIKNTLEGKEIAVLDKEVDSNKFFMRKLTKLNYQKPVCGRGLQITELSLNKTENLNDTFSNSTTLYISADDSPAYVDMLGRLRIQEEEFDTEKYCLSENWEKDGYSYRNPLDSLDGAVALSCDLCKEEVICYYLQMLYETYTRRFEGISAQYEGDTFRHNIVRVADKNGDAQVDFDELKSKIVEYLTIAFNILDRNDDGSVDEVLTNDSFNQYNLDFIEEILKNVVAFFDYNEDNSISLEDLKDVMYVPDRNRDGVFSISDLIGQSLINLPAPLYTAYTLLDEDQDEKLTMEEILSFVRRTFTIIDQNGDCYINLEEIIAALDESKLPTDFQLGLKLLGQHYFTIAKHFVDVFIAKADTNGDSKVLLEEIIGFGDFSYIESVVRVAGSMGSPHYGIVSFLGGSAEGRKGKESALVIGLTALHHFLDNPVYEAAPVEQCGLNGE